MQTALVESSAVRKLEIWKGRYRVNIKTGMFESGELNLELSRVDIEYFYARSIVDTARIDSCYPFIDQLVYEAMKTFNFQEISELTKYFVKLPDTKMIIYPAHIPAHDTLEKRYIDSLFWEAVAYDATPSGRIPFYKMLNYDLEFNVKGYYYGDKYKDIYEALEPSRECIFGINNTSGDLKVIKDLDGNTMCYFYNLPEKVRSS